ncbi:hypothetical protein [Clostridium sp. Cult2]|uniref:hypothetical protein n=1 Tax=Clostridium sp. Cult2 TaxID=2079003 RepID=UPI001F3AFD57|nr:hypothetical protein [Clostridium sp. Cult2]MCF6466355.1 hypothetical protein [Clostridium sp. Cult2]
MAKYRKKPVVIEAKQLTWGTFHEILNWIEKESYRKAYFGHHEDAKNEDNPAGQCIYIETLEGTHVAFLSDYIIKGVKGEFYPCKPDIFEMTYEKVGG